MPFSSVSTISNASSCVLDEVDEANEPFVEPDGELCVQINQQVLREAALAGEVTRVPKVMSLCPATLET